MTITTDRRHFLATSGLLAGGFATPALAKRRRGVSSSWGNVQSVLDRWVTEKRVPGAVAAVARGFDQADFMVAGTQSFGDARAMTPDSLFRAYSQTKPVTGIAAMMLIEDGKMTLDQNIADFLPAFANPQVLTEPDKSLASRPSRAPITIRGLLTHTAGLGYAITTTGPLLDAYNKLGLNPAQVSRFTLPGFPKIETAPNLAEFADRLATLPLMFDPGVRWSYSVSLDLLGRVIEIASGMSFDAFLQKRIFTPLGMTSTYFQVPEAAKDRMTTNHFELNEKPVPIDLASNSIYFDKPAFPFGGAGLVTTPRDYDRFLLMLMGEGAIGRTRIMKRETATAAMSNLVHPNTKMTSFATGQGFGAGGRVTITAKEGGEGIGTFGWGGAASTNGWVDRTKGLRASAWVQLMTRGEQSFPREVEKGVYAA